MVASPGQVIQQYLIDLGVLVPPANPGPDDWPGVVGALPSDPDQHDNYVAIQDTGSIVLGRTMRGSDTTGPTAIVSIRGVDYPTAYNKSRAIEAALRAIGIPFGQVEDDTTGAGWVQVAIDGKDYVIRSTAVVVPSTYAGEQTQNRRPVFTINIQVDHVEVTPDIYLSTYPTGTPLLTDYVLGYHNGFTTLFLISSVLGLGGGGGGSFADQPPHYVFVGPVSGANAQPSFRLLTLDDVPDRYDHS